MAGLLLIMEFKNWTKEDTLDAYRYHMNIHFALNIEPVAHDISMRTLERYINLFEEDNMPKYTGPIIEQLLACFFGQNAVKRVEKQCL